MLNVQKQQAKIMLNHIRDSIDTHLHNICSVPPMHIDDQNRQNKEHLSYVQDSTTIDHCLFLLWLQKKHDCMWFTTERVLEIITLFDLCKEDLGIDYDEFFPTRTGLNYSDFRNFFASDFYKKSRTSQ